MKLLQVVWDFPDTVMRPFDMYYFYWPVREALARGWEAEVLTFQTRDHQLSEEVIDDIQIRRCPAGVRRGKPFSWSFIQALLTTNADIIHCHGYGEGRSEIAIFLLRLRGKKVIFSPHLHFYPYRRPLREWYDWLLGRIFFQMSDRVVVFTQYTYRRLRHLGVQARHLRVIPHVARPEVFAENGVKPGKLLCQAGVTGSPLILGVGQFIERKGWAYIIKCLPAIIRYFPQVKLLIIGPSQPAEPLFREHITRLAQVLSVTEHIQILQDNSSDFIRDAYLSADLVTVPSFVESFGMVLLEAMSAGIPIVAHSGTGIPCIIDDGITGFIVDVRDTSKYTEAILKILMNPELSQRMSAAGRYQVQHRFNQKEIASQLFRVYEEVVPSQ